MSKGFHPSVGGADSGLPARGLRSLAMATLKALRLSSRHSHPVEMCIS